MRQLAQYARPAALVAGVIGLALFLGLTFVVWHRENQVAEMELNARASNYALTIQFGIDAYLRRVAALAALFDSTGSISREQFEKFSTQILQDQTAMRGMSWIPRVTHDEREFTSARASWMAFLVIRSDHSLRAAF